MQAENPPNPGSFWPWIWCHFLEPLPTGPRNRDATSGQADYTAQAIRSTARVFFPTGGEIRPGGGSSAAGCFAPLGLTTLGIIS